MSTFACQGKCMEQKILYTISMSPKSTHYIWNAQQVRKMVQFTHLSIEHPWSSSGLITHTCFVCKLCLNVGVCPWLSVNQKNKKMVPSGLLNKGNWKKCILLLLMLKYILNQILLDFYSSGILLGNFHFYFSNFLLTVSLL